MMADKECEELAESFLGDLEAERRLDLDPIQMGRLIKELAEHIEHHINDFLGNKGL